MEKTILYLNETEANILNKYKKIHSFVFRLFGYILTITISLFVTYFLVIDYQKSFQQQHNFLIEKTKLIGEFNKTLQQSIDSSNLTIHILQGILNVKGNFIHSTNNLLTYNGYVIPRYLFLYTTTPLPDISYFQTSGYDIKQLENFAKNIIFTKTQDVEINVRNIVQLPLTTNLESDFNLSCVFKTKIYNGICDSYIKDFLSYFFVYNIPKDYNGFIDLVLALEKTKHKPVLCEQLKKYMLYANDVDDKLSQLFSLCGEEYAQAFITTKLFIDIQSQLKEGYINKTVYANKFLNAYKLLSMQQILYNDIANSTVNAIRVDMYVEYVQELLKKDAIDQFYKDLTYWFNNYFLSNNLSSLSYSSSLKKEDITTIVKDLNTLNKGSQLIGFVGLSQQVSNPQLKVIKEEALYTVNEEEDEQVNYLLENIKKLSFFTITNERHTSNEAYFHGYFHIPKKELLIESYLTLKLQNNNFLVTQFLTKDYPEINDIFPTILEKNSFTLAQLYEYITDSIDLYINEGQTVPVTICDLLAINLEETDITSCTTGSITLNKSNIVYRISLDNYAISSLTVSDKEKEQALIANSNFATNQFTLIDTIKSFLTYSPKNVVEEEPTTSTLSKNILFALEDLQTKLEVVPEDITEQDGIIFAEILLQNVPFLIEYDVEKEIITDLTFKEISINGEKLHINNFFLSLLSDNQTNINLFKIDPIGYIKDKFPSIYRVYEEKINQ